MKLLWVTGDDYAATQFEQNFTIPEVMEEIKESGKKSITLEDSEGWPIYVKLYEFEEVDPNFVDFIVGELQDYDDSKHRNFFIVREK